MDNSLILIILQIGVVLASAFLINYVKKKADNYADKKDLRELTAIVEKEKSKYATDLSIIKTQLDIAAGNKKSYREKEVDSISEFYSVCNSLVYDFLNLDFGWFNSAYYNKISDMSNSFFDNIKKLAVTKGKFDLFIDNTELRKAGHELHMACINYSGKVELFIMNLKFSLENQIRLRESSLKYIQSGQKDIQKEKEIIEKERAINAEVTTYVDKYKILRKEEHDTTVIHTISQFELSARKYLSSM